MKEKELGPIQPKLSRKLLWKRGCPFMGCKPFIYLFMFYFQLLHKEKICIESIIFGTLGLGFWIASAIFFLDAATLWTVTPAESRQWNQGCIFMNFFDKHDVWHLLSAPALYFTFLYLMYLDDDLCGKPQRNIPVF